MENETRCNSCGRPVSDLKCDFDYTFETCYNCIDLDNILRDDIDIYEGHSDM